MCRWVDGSLFFFALTAAANGITTLLNTPNGLRRLWLVFAALLAAGTAA
jgi:hypothetical protein